MNIKKLLFIPMCIVAIGLSAQEINLTLKPVAKKKYDMIMQSHSDVVQSMMGTDMKVNITMNTKGLIEIEEIRPNGDFSILTSIKEAETISNIMGKETSDRSDDMNFVLRALYDQSGKLIKIERVDTSGSDEQIIATVEQMSKNLNFNTLPNGPVKVGDHWKVNLNDTVQSIGFPMIVSSDSDYSLVGTVTENGEEYYKISASGPLKVSGEGTLQGMDVQLNGTGQNEGYTLVDKTTFFPYKMDYQSGMDMSIIMSGPQSMAIPMTQNVKTTIIFSEVK